MSLLCIVFAASLLQVSVGQTPNMRVSFDTGDRNLVTLVCLRPTSSTGQPATFTFTNPLDTQDTEERSTSIRDITFSILPENETLVSCRLDDGSVEESETVAITALPRYTGTATSILQYVFSDSDTVELTCPLDTGRLHGLITPYEFLWRLKFEGAPGIDEVSNANGTFGDNNRLLSVNLSSLRPNVQYSFQCLGRLKRCNSTFDDNVNVCGEETTEATNSPFITYDFVDPVVITNPPSNVSVTQGQDAPFNCTVTNGGGDITIKWEINGVVYDSENCGDLCRVDETDNGNSTLTVHTGTMDRVMDVTTLNIVCVVTQTLSERPEGMTEYRNLSSEAAQLVLSPAPTTQPPTTQPMTPTSESISTQSVFCRNNCASEGDSGCSACNTGYTSTPKCCDCAEGYEMVNGRCIQSKCDKVQDLYFLINADISYDYFRFCSMMIVAQILAAAFNPTNCSGTKLYGVLSPISDIDVEKVFDLGDNCDMVSNKLKTLTKDFHSCKSNIYSITTFKSLCAFQTHAIKGLREIEKEAKLRTKEQKAVLILTDASIPDPVFNELGTVKSSLTLAGIETIIAASVGTKLVNENLRRYANIESNAIVADEPIELARKIVERLEAEGILCKDHAKRINDTLNKGVSEMTATLPYFCSLVPGIVSGEGCFISGGVPEFTLKFPECGGSLNIELNLGSQEDCNLKDINECTADPCPQDSRCVNTVGSYSCVCTEGYFYGRCDDNIRLDACIDINECASDPCPQDSRCVNTNGSYTCVIITCSEGYLYSRSDDNIGLEPCIDVDECAFGENDCNKDATSTNTNGSFTCECHPGYTGYGRYITLYECASDPCPQDSRCFNTDGSYSCGCSVGYFYARSDNIGLNACIDVDECAFGENDCNKDATCTNTDGSFTCECDPGYIGDGRLCIPLDELCLCDGLDHCLLSTANLSRECTCDRGYYMHLNGTCIDINECNVTAYKDTLCVHGACENTEGSFICKCSTGLMFDGNANCTDINECEIDNDCHSVAMCENTFGSYECKCPENYFGDGLHCERGIQPVINTTTLNPTLPNMKLEYNIGTSFCIEDPVNASVQFTVTCQLKELGVPTPDLQLNISLNGTDLDSNNSDVSIMISSTNRYGDVTLNDTVIVDGTIKIDRQSPLIITCMVSNSYGDTTESTYIRLCDINECQDGVTNNCNQECTRNLTSGQHQCSCKLGFELVGDTTCKAMNECAVGPDFHNCSLSNNQKCRDLPPPERYRCVCITGYYSFDGEDTCKDIDECDLQLYNCSLYSECNNTVGSYTCECMSGTEKDTDGTCKDVNECDKGPGFHNCSSSDNKKCVNQPPPGQYACECVEGYQSPDGGDFCEDIDECSLSNYTCPSLTECRNTIGSYTCTPSKRFIIPVTLTAGFVVVIIIITVIIIVCYNRLKRTAVTILKRKPKRQEAVMNDQITEMPTISRCVRMRGSISSKLSTLIIKSSNLQVKESIGQGEFGIVYKGYLTCYNNHKLVAIKTLKGFIGDGAVEELLQECARMADFKHLHVMTLLGVCLDGGPVPFLVLPYMSNGSLLTYLKKERHNLVIESEDEQLLVLTRKRLMDMCLQVAEGMEYLTTHKVVHRDLAARNCMIDMNRVIKVADFGLSVSTGSKLYFRMENATNLKLPVMWMAPESLMDYIFSEKSDIWSYGVTCWEVFSGGETPYTGVRPSSILRLLQNGERLEKTSNRACSSELYAMMLNCWEMEPDNRPNFSSIVNSLSESLEEMADYYNLGAFTELGSLD